MRAVRRALDGLYFGAGVLAALCLIAILVLIVLQMLARWTGEVFPGAPDYVGYAMASASFFAFAHALNHDAHIRVSILLNALPSRGRWVLEIWCFAIGALLAWYFAYHASEFVYWSWKFKDISQGQDASPMWIPQSGMLIGAIVFAICLTDNLLSLIFSGRHRIETAGVGAGEEG